MAYARKLPSGRWQGIAKEGRQIIATKAWPTKREAVGWAERTETAAAGGLDLCAGKVTVGKLLPAWIAHRRETVSPKTARTDAELLRLVSPALKARQIASVQARDVEAWLIYLRRQRGQGDASVRRYRLSLSAFFAWAVADHRIAANPVRVARLPRPVGEPVEMRPFIEEELAEVVDACAAYSARLADVILIAAWTGLRWGELRALRVGDIQEVPTPALRVQRSQTEGGQVKVPKGGRARRVPLADITLPAVERAADGKFPGDLLVTGPEGGQLWRSAVIRTLRWGTTGRGRRLHDLRHTAACLWLARGVDPGTVQAWMGHASIATTNSYLHYLGTSADAAGLAHLNAPAADGGAPGVHARPVVTRLRGGDSE